MKEIERLNVYCQVQGSELVDGMILLINTELLSVAKEKGDFFEKFGKEIDARLRED